MYLQICARQTGNKRNTNIGSCHEEKLNQAVVFMCLQTNSWEKYVATGLFVTLNRTLRTIGRTFIILLMVLFMVVIFHKGNRDRGIFICNVKKKQHYSLVSMIGVLDEVFLA